jgi:hypothetical protein
MILVQIMQEMHKSRKDLKEHNWNCLCKFIGALFWIVLHKI